MGFIYKITNTVNGKVYVGQTRRTIAERWKQHIQASIHPSRGYTDAIHCAIRKYGADAFAVEQIEQCSNSELNSREKHWIKELCSNKHGYNMLIGGGGGAKCDDEILVNLWNDGLSTKEIATKMGLCVETVVRQLKVNGVEYSEIYKRKNEVHSKLLSKPIYQYDKDGNYVGEFPSKRAAERAMGINWINTRDPRLHLYGGYQWRRYKTDKIDPVEETQVYQYALDGTYIRAFKDFAEAARTVGYHSGNVIASVCKGVGTTAHGYRWSLQKLDRLPKMGRSKYRKVVRISLDGDERKIYNSVREASSENKATAANIVAVCRGKAKTSGGYIWQYID